MGNRNRRDRETKKKLSVSAFLKLVPDRVKKIAGAPDSSVKPVQDYPVNILANELHPRVQHLKVVRVTEESEGTKLYTLAADPDSGTASPAPFAAGQYISVSIKKDGMTYSRPYSIASSPEEAREDGIYEIAVKKVHGGPVSENIHWSWKEGAKVTVSEPCGEFTYERLRDAGTVIGIAGGVGITPFRSYVREIMRVEAKFSMILIYGIRKESDILFRSEFDEAAESGRIKVVYVLSDEYREGFEKGLVTAELIRKYAPETDYSVFACGPDAMYRFLDKELPSLGLRKKFIRYDARGRVTVRDETDYVAADREEYKVTVMRNGVSATVECRADEPLMDALERGGIAVPSRCRSGQCGFCHSRLVSGEIYAPASREGRRKADMIYGYIHPCVTFPRSDLVIDVPPVPEETPGGEHD